MKFYAHTLKNSKSENLFTFVKFADERLTSQEFMKRTGAKHTLADLAEIQIGWQLLSSHLVNVAEQSRTFAEFFGLAEEAFLAGLLHDLGKYQFVGAMQSNEMRRSVVRHGARIGISGIWPTRKFCGACTGRPSQPDGICRRFAPLTNSWETWLMKLDPILEELWKIKDELAREAGYDTHRFFENLRQWEAEHPHDGPVVVNAEGLRELVSEKERARAESSSLALKEEPPHPKLPDQLH